MTPEELYAKVVKIPFSKLFLLYQRYEYEATKKPVTNPEITAYLKAIGGYCSVAQIMEALDYHADDCTSVCARLRGMEKRKNQRVQSAVINGVKHYRLNP